MAAHKHAALMAEYAKDAMEIEKPWERWEYYDGATWSGLLTSPSWRTSYEYRRIDPYRELKAAAADPTKQIRVVDEGGWSNWYDGCGSMSWRWTEPVENYEIRDKPKEKKKIKLLAWFTGESFYWRVGAYKPIPDHWKRVPSEDKIIEVEE